MVSKFQKWVEEINILFYEKEEIRGNMVLTVSFTFPHNMLTAQARYKFCQTTPRTKVEDD